MSKEFYMGGTAIFQFSESAGGFIVAMTGEFKGGAFAQIIGQNDLGNGQTEYDLKHYFIREDGSTIETVDKGLFIAVEGQERILASTTYNIVKTTGAFEGLKGSFQSWGSVNGKTMQGVLRFSGELK